VELIDYVHILRRRAILMVLIIAACVGGAWFATTQQIKTYQAHAELIVNGSSQLGAADEIVNRQLAADRAVAFAQIAGTAPAISAAADHAQKVAGPFSSGARVSITATADGTSPFIQINVEGSRPAQLQAVANAYEVVLPRVLNQLNQEPLAIAEQLKMIQPAGLPVTPTSPRLRHNLLVGGGIGIALALLAAFIWEALDRKLRDSDEVERVTKLQVLGAVPSELPKSRTPVSTDPHSARAEAYRKIRTNLLFTTPNGVPRALLITSAVSGEGKTTLAVNLALACARAGQRVGLVDADMRRPMVAEYLGIDGSKGLSDVLTGALPLAAAVQSIDDGKIDVIAAGPIPPNPTELLGSLEMREAMAPFIRDHDVVIIDAPPVLPVADALVLAGRVEAVVLVTRVRETLRHRVLSARDAILKVKGNLIGIIPNAVVAHDDSAYNYHYRGYSRKQNAYLKATAENAIGPVTAVSPDARIDDLAAEGSADREQAGGANPAGSNGDATAGPSGWPETARPQSTDRGGLSDPGLAERR